MRFVIPFGRSRVVVGLLGLVVLAPVAVLYWLVVGCGLVVVAVAKAEVWAVRFVVRRWRESRE